MSYREPFFNLARNRTLRGYTRPVDLPRFHGQGWSVRDETMDTIAAALERAPRVLLFSRQQIRAFSKVDAVTHRADPQRADPLDYAALRMLDGDLSVSTCRHTVFLTRMAPKLLQ